MTIQNAIHFLLVTVDDSAHRDELYRLGSRTDFARWLVEHSIPFQMDEFEESVNLLHVKCQTIEQADQLLHRVDFTRMIWNSLTIE